PCRVWLRETTAGGGCSTAPDHGYAPAPARIEAVVQSAAPASAGANTTAKEVAPAPAQTNSTRWAKTDDKGNKLVRPGYEIKVRVVVDDKVEIETGLATVSEEGGVFLPLLKQVRVAGMTAAGAEASLSEQYSRYFVAPRVYLDSIPPKEITPQEKEQAAMSAPKGYVSVTGRVKSPGLVTIPATSELTLSQAILLAGGLNFSAKDRAVRLTRRKPDGSVELRTVNLRAIVEQGRLADDAVLQAGDIIYVPETLF
ncbi:MAG: polysaccharide biosynthesis/export family protein, partial [Planctomycetota bacterium]